MIEKGCLGCVCTGLRYDEPPCCDCAQFNQFEPSKLYTAYLEQKERADKAEARLARYADPNPKCNKGHVNNLPLALWDCPVCVEEMRAENEALKAAKGRTRLTGTDYKQLGFHTYDGPLNPYSAPLTLGELSLSDGVTMPTYSARKMLDEVFARLAEYEDTLAKMEGGG